MMIILIIVFLSSIYMIPNIYYRRKLFLNDRTGSILTFDDGPSLVTEEIGNILYKENIKGCFFVVAKEAEKNPKIILKLVEQGHEIGFHCYSHRHPALSLPFKRYRELALGYKILEELGCSPKYYRPPHGFYTIVDYIFIKKYNVIATHWSSLLEDWKEFSVNEMTDRLISNTLPGAVLVLHDGAQGSANINSHKMIPEVLKSYLKELKIKNLALSSWR